MCRRWVLTVTIVVLGVAATGAVRATEPDPRGTAADKVEPLVLQQIERAGSADFFVTMVRQAELGPASGLRTKRERGAFVLSALQRTAAESQRELRALLGPARCRLPALLHLERDPGSRRHPRPARRDRRPLRRGADQRQPRDADGRRRLDLAGPDVPRAVEPNLVFVGAPDVWNMGSRAPGSWSRSTTPASTRTTRRSPATTAAA